MEKQLKDTLTEYLVAESSLEDIVSLESARQESGLRHRNNSNAPNIPATVYAALRIQKHRQLDTVAGNIEEFTESLEVATDTSSASPDVAFERLIQLMEALEQSVNERTNGLLWDAENVTHALGNQVGSLQDFHVNESEVDERAVEGVLESLGELNKLLNHERNP
ncbi:hypothetical protein CJU90_5965 [Yarrowia sp. C11]|nr:hypothetical protein CJU90_5965 [Yarrowia sp. C11]KAG5370682.1 hypothetical protein CKK34_0806 [Yarrowia sp. E02]